MVSVTPRQPFTPGKGLTVPGLRAGLDTEAKGIILYLCRRSNPDRSVYLLIPGPRMCGICMKNCVANTCLCFIEVSECYAVHVCHSQGRT
jgi:hypothetical protein